VPLMRLRSRDLWYETSIRPTSVRVAGRVVRCSSSMSGDFEQEPSGRIRMSASSRSSGEERRQDSVIVEVDEEEQSLQYAVPVGVRLQMFPD
jgi:hypothetical protein